MSENLPDSLTSESASGSPDFGQAMHTTTTIRLRTLLGGREEEVPVLEGAEARRAIVRETRQAMADEAQIQAAVDAFVHTEEDRAIDAYMRERYAMDLEEYLRDRRNVSPSSMRESSGPSPPRRQRHRSRSRGLTRHRRMNQGDNSSAVVATDVASGEPMPLSLSQAESHYNVQLCLDTMTTIQHNLAEIIDAGVEVDVTGWRRHLEDAFPPFLRSIQAGRVGRTFPDELRDIQCFLEDVRELECPRVASHHVACPCYSPTTGWRLYTTRQRGCTRTCRIRSRSLPPIRDLARVPAMGTRDNLSESRHCRLRGDLLPPRAMTLRHLVRRTWLLGWGRMSCSWSKA